MDTDDYQKKLRELGINRGKLETGFVEKDAEPEDAPKLSGRPSAPPENIEKSTLSTGSKVSVKLTNFSDKRVVNNPVNKCRCGVTISDAAKRCRKCFREDMRKTWKAAEQGISLPPAPSPPVAPAPPAEEEPSVLWSVLGEPEIMKIAEAVIRGNGGIAHIDDITAAVEELTRSRVSSMLCTLVLRGDIGISCHQGKVSYCKPSLIATDWDYVI